MATRDGNSIPGHSKVCRASRGVCICTCVFIHVCVIWVSEGVHMCSYCVHHTVANSSPILQAPGCAWKETYWTLQPFQ